MQAFELNTHLWIIPFFSYIYTLQRRWAELRKEVMDTRFAAAPPAAERQQPATVTPHFQRRRHRSTVSTLDSWETLTSTSHRIRILIGKEKKNKKKQKRQSQHQTAGIMCGISPLLMYCRLLCLSA